MVLTINTQTGIIRDYPQNILRHRKLGKNLEVYVEPSEDNEVEEDKVVFQKKISKRVKLVTEDPEVLAAHQQIAESPELYTPAEDLP